MSDSSDSSDGELEMPRPTDMPEGLVEIFKSFLLSEDYTAALDFVSDCFGFYPTPFVVNEILFKIIMKCDEDLAQYAQDYLVGAMRIIPRHDDQNYDVIKALINKSASDKDVWNVFSDFVWSSLYHLLSRKIPEAFNDHSDYVKNPNCEILVEVYVTAFLKCPIKSVVLGSRVEKRFSSLLKWINLFYKFNIQMKPVLENLHKLMDYILESEISSDTSLPLCVRIHTANLSPYLFQIVNVCKDVFTTLESQQRFFNNISSTSIIMRICQYRLHELIKKDALPQNPRMLTLKSIVCNYFFDRPKEDTESNKQSSSNSLRLTRGKKFRKFSKMPLSGDTEFHTFCRLGKPADLLSHLYDNSTKDINIKNSVGNTPLHEACLASSHLCAKFLFEEAGDRTLDYSATDNDGRTPLHCAAHVDSFDIVKLILNRGGKHLIKCEDNWGKRPVHYCTSSEMKEFLENVESELADPVKDSCEGAKLPSLKKIEDLAIYLRTLKTLTSSYCEIYDLPKEDLPIPTLSHENKECYHYKASNQTLCMDDSAFLANICDIIEKFISCAKLVATEKSAKEELRRWNTFLAAFK